MKTVSLQRNKPAIRLENAKEIYNGQVKEIKLEGKIKNILNRPLYLLDDNTAYGIIQVKELIEEGGMFVYKFEFLSKFPSPKPADSKESGTLLDNFEFTDRKEEPDENLKKLIEKFDDFNISRDIICITGEAVRNLGDSEELNISVRLEEPSELLKEKIETTIVETLPDEIKDKTNISWSKEEEGDFVPLFDLKLERKDAFEIIRNPELGEIKPFRKFKIPESGTKTYYNIDKVLKELL